MAKKLADERLKKEVEWRQKQKALQQANTLLHAIHDAQSRFIADVQPQEIFERLLSSLLELTQSEYGFIGEVLYTSDGAPYLKTYAITNIAWNDEMQTFYDTNAPEGMKFYSLETLFGTVMTTGRSVISNNPSQDPRRGGLPEGHPPIHAFMGLPFYQGSTLHGMVGVANRPGGYDDALIGFLQPFLATCSNLIAAITTDQQRRMAEEKLHVSEERYRTVVEDMPAMICRFLPDGTLTFVNSIYCQYFGRQKEDLIGHNFFQFIPVEDQGKVKDHFTSLCQEKPLITYEHQVFAPDGTVLWQEWTDRALFNETGAIIEYQSIGRDISDRKRAEEALRLNESRLNSLFELSQKAHQLSEKEIVQFGLEEAVRLTESKIGYFHFVNQDQETIELYTWSHNTLQECTAAPEKHYPISQAGVWADCVRIGKAVVHNDYPHLPYKRGLPEGHSDMIRHMSVPVIDEGKIRVITGVGNKERDYNDADMRQLQLLANDVWKIVQHKRVEAERETLITELEAKNTELERFTYTVSHDLKSPLITIQGFLGFLEQDAIKDDTERLQADVQRIREATNTMYRLLNDLLELSRIGRMMNPPQEAPFVELVREVNERLVHQIDERGVQMSIAADLPVIFGDRPRLVEVLQNLLENAIKFMGDQSAPQIEIGMKPDGDCPVLYVADNGIGIDPRYYDKVFGLFERLDPEVEGTGVGLALVKRIIEVHGGRIWVESEGPGRGSTFYFTLAPKEE